MRDKTRAIRRGDFVLRDTVKDPNSGGAVNPGKYNTQENAERYSSSGMNSRVKGGRFYEKRSEKAGDFIIGISSGQDSPGPAHYGDRRIIKPVIEPGRSLGRQHTNNKGCLVVRSGVKGTDSPGPKHFPQSRQKAW